MSSSPSAPAPPLQSSDPMTPFSDSNNRGAFSESNVPPIPEHEFRFPAPPTQRAQFRTPLETVSARASRTRRQDPSCDACRKRKVKCDATATTACRECRARGLQCNFSQGHRKSASQGSTYATEQLQYLQALEDLSRVQVLASEQTHTITSIQTVLDAVPAFSLSPNRENVDEVLLMTSAKMAATLFEIRFLLCRPSLQLSRNLEDGQGSFSKCVRSAQATAQYFDCLLPGSEAPAGPSGQAHDRPLSAQNLNVLQFATTTFCTQVWRCTVILVMGLELEVAAKCTRLSAAVGSAQSVNTICGQHLITLLERLSHLRQGGPLSLQTVLHDSTFISIATSELREEPSYNLRSKRLLDESMGAATSSAMLDVQASEGSSSSPRGQDPWLRVQSLLEILIQAQGPSGQTRPLSTPSSRREQMLIPNLISG